jgi:DNA-binding IclR family transcriptional regulator
MAAGAESETITGGGSVAQALAILRYLSRSAAPERASTIGRTLGFSLRSCSNVLRTMVAAGYVDYDPISRRYELGWEPVQLARRKLNGDGLLTLVNPAMIRFADRHGVACGLGRVTRREHIVLVGFTESTTAPRTHLTFGQRVPLLAGASGRCVAAHLHLSLDQLKRRFEGLRWEAAPTITEFLAQVDEARSRGWAIDTDQAHRGITTLSAPLRDLTGSVRYTLTATMFTGRSKAEIEAIAAELVRLANTAAERFFSLNEDGGLCFGLDGRGDPSLGAPL